MTAIRIRGLNKTFSNNNRALKDIGLSVNQGEMIALIGASGSGKSTLIRHIAGLVVADKGDAGGSITVLGEIIQSQGKISRQARKTRVRVAVIFQQFNLVARMGVLTNVLTGLLGRISGVRGTLGMFSKAEKIVAMMALGRVGIAATASQRASTLSGGQQQRAAIARALVQEAEIILADEPIASLDPASSKRVMEALKEINEQDGRTVIVSLHQVDYALEYCPRVVALRAGEVVFDGPSAALNADMLQNLYGADCEELIGAPQPETIKMPPMTSPILGPEVAVAPI